MPDRRPPIWLPATDIRRFNKIVVAATGENHHVLSSHLLESAAARPQNLYDYEQIDDLIILGVRLIEAVGKNHCFEQGNKRTAFHSGLVFMQRNEIYFDLADTQELAELVTAIITGESQPSTLVDLLRQRQW